MRDNRKDKSKNIYKNINEGFLHRAMEAALIKEVKTDEEPELPNNKSDRKISHNQIAQRAYFLWQLEGSPATGNDFQNWLQAEKSLFSERRKP